MAASFFILFLSKFYLGNCKTDGNKNRVLELPIKNFIAYFDKNDKKHIQSIL